MFTNFFIRRPVFASVCSLLIMLLGLVGYTRLPVQEFPSIDPPIVTITTVYPGASPEVVETEVTEVLEEQLGGLDGIKSITSSSGVGSSQVTLQFNLERDLEAAAQDVRGRVAQARGELPEDVEDPVVEKATGDDQVIWFGLTGADYSLVDLTDYADNLIVPQLEAVPGIASVFVAGERQKSMRLWLNPQRLAARDLTVLDVESALRSQNVELPAGNIEGGLAEYSVRTLGRLRTPEEYEAMVIQQNDDGTQSYLRDVGRAEIGPEETDSFVRLNGGPALALGINKVSRANTLDVTRLAKQRMVELAEDFPAGMEYTIAYDPTEFVRISIREAWSSLAQAIILVIVVIFFFLRDWRATIVPAVTIPVSLIGALAVMYFLDYSINTLTLFALTLSTGLVVDDAIVVLENISRNLRERQISPMQAAFEGVGEVVFAVIATTIVLVAVFMPVAFASGSVGRLFNEFALSIAGAVVISSFVALTLAPALAGRLLTDRTLHWFFLDWFEALVNGARRAYQASLELALRLRFVVVAIFFASFALMIGGYRLLPSEFLPTEDRGIFLTIIRAPEGVSLAYTDQILAQAGQLIQQNVPEAESRFEVGGFSGGGGINPNQGIMFTALSPWSERTQPQQSARAIVGKLFGLFFSQITGAFAFPIQPSGLPGAGFGQPVQFVLQGDDLNTLAQAAGAIAGQAQTVPQLANVRSSLQIDKPEIAVTINRELAARTGVSVADIAQTLQILLGGEKITSFNEGKNRYEVVVEADPAFRSSPSQIDEIYVRSSNGDAVPLGNLVDFDLQTTAASISHYNRLRSATIEGSPGPGYTLGQALDALEQLADQTLANFPDGIRTTLAGESLEFREAGASTQLIFGLALAFIFLVLAAQFESYIDPIIILLAIPLSLLGAFGALFIFGQTLNVYSQIGIIMLIGLSTKNSILIVEFANQLRAQGLTPIKAATQAATIRFRPILMTAFSTIFGLMPLALSRGAGAASRIPLGLAVIGGMLVSTILSLYVVPAFYTIAAKAQERRQN